MSASILPPELITSLFCEHLFKSHSYKLRVYRLKIYHLKTKRHNMIILVCTFSLNKLLQWGDNSWPLVYSVHITSNIRIGNEKKTCKTKCLATCFSIQINIFFESDIPNVQHSDYHQLDPSMHYLVPEINTLNIA